MSVVDLLKQDRATLPANFQQRFDDATEFNRHTAQLAEQDRIDGLNRMSVVDLLKQDRATLPPDLQQRFDSFAEDQRVQAQRNAAVTTDTQQGQTNPGKFTAAQVASYIKEQKVPPADYAKTAVMFGIPTELLNQGVALLTQNDPSVTAATTAYNTAIAANPAQGAANNSWVASQAANTPAQQAATLNAIDTVKSPTGALTQTQGTTMPITDNPGNLTAAQVAAYIRDQGVKPADYATTAQAFGIPMSLLTQGLYLLAKNDPSVQATSTAYSNAVAANPAQGATNNAWVAQQLAAPSSVQQNTLGVIDAYKNNAPASNPSGFTAAQVAAYIRDQKIAPTDYAKTAAMFGIDPALLSAGVTLLNSGSSTVNDASNAYAHIVGDDPSKGVRNNAWVAGQTAKTPAEQQAELDRIAGVKATTNPGKFDAMHVAAFLKDQNIKAADYGKFANMFGIDAGLLSDGVSLLDSNNPGVTSVSDLYKATIAGTNQGALNDAWVASQAARNPTGQAQELFGISGVKTGGAGTYNPGTGTGLTRVPTTTDPIINPTVGPLTTKTAPLPAPSTAANSFDTPVLNALYTQQRQNMTSQAPTFNFQNGAQQTTNSPTFKRGGRVGGLTRAIKGY
jgi:hypothetical protein